MIYKQMIFLKELLEFVCTQLNGFKHPYLKLIILFNFLFICLHREMVSSLAI